MSSFSLVRDSDQLFAESDIPSFQIRHCILAESVVAESGNEQDASD